MLKIKQIEVSGFRGILKPWPLNLNSESLVIFGHNSYGKSSLADSLEWFLSPQNKIEYLNREDAKEKSYPHQKADNTYIKIKFSESGLEELEKKYNFSTPTIPTIVSKESFNNLYSKYVIPPYLRNSELAIFILASKANKYKELSRWMGFGLLLDYQEKIEFGITNPLKEEKSRLEVISQIKSEDIKKVISDFGGTENEIIDFCNNIFEKYKLEKIINFEGLEGRFKELSLKQINTEQLKQSSAILSTKNEMESLSFNKGLYQKLILLSSKIKNFKEKGDVLPKISLLQLCELGLSVLNGKGKTTCPLCDKPWDTKEKLFEHIKLKINNYTEIKNEKEKLEDEAKDLAININKEKYIIDSLSVSAKKIVLKLNVEKKRDFINKYKDNLQELKNILLGDNIFSLCNYNNEIFNTSFEECVKDVKYIVERLKEAGEKITPTDRDKELISDVAKIKRLLESWDELNESQGKMKFYTSEIEKFIKIRDELVEKIKVNIEGRFNQISDKVDEYFKILRPDKDIRNIKIELVSRNKASGRSAEINLDFYDVNISPAYKILSESLLNSLGLAIYFACVKEFNKDCGFIILDDIINSLDKDNRGNIIKLIEEKFSDYQLIILTHDDLWFEQIINRFPKWMKLKILRWEYDSGPIVNFAKTTEEEIEELLKDSQCKIAGSKLGDHLEGVLNILCERLKVKTEHRYQSRQPFTLCELFEGVCSRLRDKIKKDDEGFNLIKEIGNISANQIGLRNFCNHDRSQIASSLSPEDIKNASNEWFGAEKYLFCPECKKYVFYDKKDGYEHIFCPCNKLKLK
ncbi:MAG: DUF2813 domain-containing protein [Patescibacteria group bacterium]|jgi:energy-coupling factor transporter ATP-binding protein EcfA2